MTLSLKKNIKQERKNNMTRDEQIKQYAMSFKGKDMENEELKEIIRLAIIDGATWADANPVQPSLPSNIDEAAEEYAYTNWQSDDYHEGASEGLPFDAIGHTEKCFKAGSEWMKGQMK